jgi:uncharacterized protein (TIGR03437 family)
MKADINRVALAAILLLPGICRAQALSGYVISTVAGNGTSGFSGDGGGATGAQLSSPAGVAVDSSGTLYIADQLNHRVRAMGTDGTIKTVAGVGTTGYSGDGGAPTNAALAFPGGLAVDGSGNIYVADAASNVVRKVAGSSISTVAGNHDAGAGFSGDGGEGTSAQLNAPSGLAVDAAGNLYIADTGNNRIRKLAGGTITTVVGNAAAGYYGDGGAASQASLNAPRGVFVDAAGNLYIADTGNNRIRMVAGGIITTVAGSGVQGFAGDGGLAVRAQLNRPSAVAADGAGNLFVVDSLNSRLRVVSPAGVIATIAGNGKFAYAGDGSAATGASLSFPAAVVLDPSGSGNIYLSDGQNNAIRLIARPASTAVPPALAPGAVASAGGYGGSTSIAPGSWIEIHGSNLATGTRSWASGDFHGQLAPTSLDGTTVTVGGQAAFVAYISPGQVNAQVPAVGPGPQTLTVSTAAGTSDPYTVTVNPTQPGLLAPASFLVGGKQYVTALYGDGTTYVLPPGTIPGITSRPARPGDTIVFYGIGFGTVDPKIAPGETARLLNSLNSKLQIFFAQTPGTLTYAGLAPGAVGLYQFDVVVPNVGAGDAVPVTFTLDGISGTQTLFTAIQE